MLNRILKFRPMYDSDIDDVSDIEESAHISPWSKSIIRECVAVGYDCRVLEVIEGNEDKAHIAGYIISRYHEHSYHILNLCIKKSQQRKGLGRILLDYVCDSLVHDKNINCVVLEVRTSNSAALSLYHRVGFEVVDIKKGYYSSQLVKEDALVLKKPSIIYKGSS